MNFYQHHLGDWAAATAHLTLIEDAVYSRMIRRYYISESPLPVDHVEVCRLVGARTKAERKAVDSVLAEFFVLEADGYHQSRCDSEIADYLRRQDGVDQVRNAEQERMRRHRQERAELYAGLREHGVSLAWNAPIQRVRELAAQYGIKARAAVPAVTCNAPATEAETHLQRTCNAPATANPIPNTQLPIPKNTHSNSGGSSVQRSVSLQAETHETVLTVSMAAPATRADPLQVTEHPAPTGHEPTPAGRICRMMKGRGIADVNPGNPRLIALIESGVSDEQFNWAALQAVERRKGFVYALGCLSGAIAEAQQTVKPGAGALLDERQPTQNEIDMFLAAPTLFKGAEFERMNRFVHGAKHGNHAVTA